MSLSATPKEKKPNEETHTYIGWVGFGNHGDDICRDVFIRRFKIVAEASIDLEVTALFPSAFDELALARLRPDLVVLGAGSLFELIHLKPSSWLNSTVYPLRFGVQA